MLRPWVAITTSLFAASVTAGVLAWSPFGQHDWVASNWEIEQACSCEPWMTVIWLFYGIPSAAVALWSRLTSATRFHALRVCKTELLARLIKPVVFRLAPLWKLQHQRHGVLVENMSKTSLVEGGDLSLLVMCLVVRWACDNGKQSNVPVT